MRVSRDSSFAAIEVLLIDGNNLLHRLSGGVDSGALRGLLPRIVASVPQEIAAILMLDGHPAPGTGRAMRVGPGLQIRYAGSLSADDALLNIVRDQPPGGRSATTVVTDDIALRNRLRHLGAYTQRLAWLEAQLAGGHLAAGIGRGGIRPPPQPATDQDEREPWKPGRGATRKRGNPRRAPR